MIYRTLNRITEREYGSLTVSLNVAIPSNTSKMMARSSLNVYEKRKYWIKMASIVDVSMAINIFFTLFILAPLIIVRLMEIRRTTYFIIIELFQLSLVYTKDLNCEA